MFDKIREVYLEEYHGKGTLYRHKASGMEAFHIKNDSEELSCAFMFATPSQDDMGVAHILEHTVLAGSGRYPVKDPFDAVLKSSPNTFLNALTYTDKTVFPFASPLKKDFDILFGIYADSVFNPLLRKENFEQQGIRFFDDKFDGVVFNEMCGATSSEDDFVSDYCVKKLYEGTAATYKSGGDPIYIADLTYEEFTDRYRSWYSPANCRLFLFGDLNAEEYLQKLENLYLDEENLKKWKGIKFIPSPEKYAVKEYHPVREKVPCPVENTNSVVMTWLTTPTTDPLENLTLNILVDILLGDPGAPLYKAATESDLGVDLNSMSGTDVDFPLMPFIYGFTGAKKDKEDQIEAFIMEELGKIVKNGLDPLQVEAAIKRREFKMQEIQGSDLPYGLSAAFRSSRNWLRGGNPEDALIVKPVLDSLKEKVKQGPYFEQWIEKNLLNNPRRCLLTVYYDKNYEDNKQDILKQKLVKRKAEYTEEELNKRKECFESFVNSEDSPEDLATIERIKISDLPTNIPVFKQEYKKVQNAQVLVYPIFTNGIVYLNIAFNTMGLTLEEKKLLPLLTRLMEMCSTKKNDYVKIGSLCKLYMGDFSISISNGLDQNSQMQSFVYVKTKMLYEDLENAVNLTEEILNQCILSDTDRIKVSVTEICTDFESEYLYNAHRFAMLKAGSMVSESMLESEITGGTSCYQNMKQISDSKDSFKTLSAQLTNLHSKIFNQNNMTVQIATEEQYMEQALNTVDAMICKFSKLNNVRSADLVGKLSEQTQNQCFLTVSNGPAYNAMISKLTDTDQKKIVAKMLYASALGNGKLWDVVRGKNGAYGVFSTVNLQEKLLIFVSYRDPNIEKTFEAFEDCLDTEISDEEKDFVIVSVIGKELKPLTPQGRAVEAFRRYLYSMTDELYLQRRQAMLSLTIQDVKEAAQELKEVVEKQNFKATICGQEMLKDKNAENITRVGL